MSQPVIECHNLTKAYDNGVIALDNLNLTIADGTSFGLIGENGAGKSTLVRLLLGFVFPTSGTLKLLGQTKVQLVHPLIGYLHERTFVELRMSGWQYLGYMAELVGLAGADKAKRVAAVLEQVDLTAASNEKMATYSKGMLQRISIAQILLNDPQLLILDEPTSGLDPYSQWKMRSIIAGLRQAGKTIFLCSHQLAEVETLCDTVGILKSGRLVKCEPVVNMLDTTGQVAIVLAGDESASSVVQRLNLGGQVARTDGQALFLPASAQTAVLTALLTAGVAIRSLNPVTATLEEVYIGTTQATSLAKERG